MERNSKPKLSIANDLVNWINAGGGGMTPNAQSFMGTQGHT